MTSTSTSTDTRHAYAPLFDEREFTRWNVYDQDSTSLDIPCLDENEPDSFLSRLIHDQQFVDLSERYDPIEATVDAHLEPCRLTVTERLLIAASFASAAAMALAACLS